MYKEERFDKKLGENLKLDLQFFKTKFNVPLPLRSIHPGHRENTDRFKKDRKDRRV